MAETILDSFEIGGDRIVIREVDENDQRIRYLLVNGGEESACYSEPGMHNELKFIYTRKLAQLFEIFPSFQNSLLIGGGGFSLPRYLISHYPDHTMDVVELSPQIVEIAKKYFFLEELREKYDAGKDERLHIIIDEGCHYLSTCEKQYDLIINDAYIGETFYMDFTLGRLGESVKARLSENGLYAVNVYSALTGSEAELLLKVEAMLKAGFKNVGRLYCPELHLAANERQNCILLAADSDESFSKLPI
ncbi:MAG: fused MFS/spermidine synthase [Lachnospiraceae bacterium]|nr:fused MFS/spermidine synthase [Lachnospiraceae bacterium]